MEACVSIRGEDALVVESLIKVVAFDFFSILDLLTLDIDVLDESRGDIRVVRGIGILI